MYQRTMWSADMCLFDCLLESNQTIATKTCQHCGVSFVPARRTKGLFCGVKCANNYKSNKARAFACEWCSKRFGGKHADGRRRSGNVANRFCSRDCAFEFRRVRGVAGSVTCEVNAICSLTWVGEARKICVACGKPRGRLSTGLYCRNHNCPLAHKRGVPTGMSKCKYCGKCWKASSRYSLKRCPECIEKIEKRHAKEWKRDHGNHRKRCRVYGGRYTPVKQDRIFERDNWACKMCGSAVRRGQKMFKGCDLRTYASIDHIIPLSRGGSHTEDNLQTLCMYCNSHKRDKMLALAA